MAVFPILHDLEKEGKLKELVKGGVLSTRVLKHYEIYLEFDKLKRTTKMRVSEIVFELSERFKLSEVTIYKIKKDFECK